MCWYLVLGVGPLQGLGAALAWLFAAEGLQEVIASRSSAEPTMVADAIADAGDVAIPVVDDATVESDIQQLFETASAAAGFRKSLPTMSTGICP